MRQKILHAIIYICFMYLGASCILKADDSYYSAIDRIFALMSSTPSWPLLGFEDDVMREQIDEAYMQVAQYDSSTIRSAMERYIRCCFVGDSCVSTHNFSVFNMVVLNRFVFSVPEWISKEELESFPFYLGMGIPQNEKGGNILWPLSLSDDGKVSLTSMFYARGGPLPDPLKEFDIFAEKFGRR